MLAEHEEAPDEALRLYGESLALWRELVQERAVAQSLVAMARIEATRGDVESARTRLEEALALAQEVSDSQTTLAATVESARLPGGDVDAALAALKEHGDRVEHAHRMDVCFRLWELTGDETHLQEAHRLLDHLVENAPEKYRETMIENVPLHRDIMAAWREHGVP
jgi:predicted TPR repeat methyltransferase